MNNTLSAADTDDWEKLVVKGTCQVPTTYDARVSLNSAQGFLFPFAEFGKVVLSAHGAA